MHIFWGILGIAVAYLLVRFRGNVYNFTGPWSFAEKYFGGTNAGILLIAILIFFLSVATLLGKTQQLFGSTLGRFF